MARPALFNGVELKLRPWHHKRGLPTQALATIMASDKLLYQSHAGVARQLCIERYTKIGGNMKMRYFVIIAIGISCCTNAFAQEHKFLHNTNPSNALFKCEQDTIGQTACQAGHRCKCEYNAFADRSRGLPAGYRWNCGLTQGTCMSDVPATTSGNYGNGQPAIPAPNVIMNR